MSAPRLTAQRDKLRAECERVTTAIATGGDTLTTLVPRLRQYEREIATLEADLRRPRPERLDVERLREALTLRAANWKRDLRAEPQVARLVIRRLIDPIVLIEPGVVPRTQSREGLDGDDVTWEAPTKPRLLGGLVPIHDVAEDERERDRPTEVSPWPPRQNGASSAAEARRACSLRIRRSHRDEPRSCGAARCS